MPIFKKASVAPIVRTVISQGIDDENNTDPAFEQAELGKKIDDSWSKDEGDTFFSYDDDEKKVASLFNNAMRNGLERRALLIASLYFEGFMFESIRDTVANIHH